jgi:glucose/arabinose dehydrogenase
MRFALRTTLAAAAAAPLAAAPAAGQEDWFLQRVATGLSRPVFVAAPPGDLERAFIVEQRSGSVGRIRILELDTLTVLPTPFLSISPVATGFEEGLLGLAFHPDYASNRTFFVHYTNSSGNIVIARYQADADDANLADPGTATTVLIVDHPSAFNHNGGWLGFGPDGYLYATLGDGGGSNDGDNNAQDITDNLLGSILRLDVDGDDFPADPNRNYAIPADNPFVGITGDDEIWAYGLRNPFRASFDRATGDLYIGDVGQGAREEVDVQPAASAGGANYGWRLREGTIATPSGGVGGPKPPGAIDPIFDYTHEPEEEFWGISVIGGYVYRGAITTLRGRYFFSDYLNARLFSLRWDGSDPLLFDGTNYTELTDHGDDPRFVPDVGTLEEVSSLGEDGASNLYVMTIPGDVFRLTPLAVTPGAAGLGPLLPAALAAAAWLGLRRARPRTRGRPPG